jgi:putative peptidoglycan lipid II flippase
MKISILCLGLNLIFALWLVQPYREAGLAVANTLSATFNTLLLLYALRRKLSRVGMTQIVKTLLVLLPSALAAGLVAAGLAWLWDKQLGHKSFPVKLGAVFIPGSAGVLVYWVLSTFGGVTAAKEITTLLLRIKDRLRPT